VVFQERLSVHGDLLSSKDEMLSLEQPLLLVKLPPRKVKSMESL